MRLLTRRFTILVEVFVVFFHAYTSSFSASIFCKRLLMLLIFLLATPTLVPASSNFLLVFSRAAAKASISCFTAAKRRTVPGKPSLAVVQLRRKERPRGENSTTQRPPSHLRCQTRLQIFSFTVVINEWHSHKTSLKGSGWALIRNFLLKLVGRST